VLSIRGLKARLGENDGVLKDAGLAEPALQRTDRSRIADLHSTFSRL